MQKKLVGVAVATALAAPALALAQTGVQLYGTVHMSLNHTKFDDVAAPDANVSKFAVNQHSSNWGLRSTETLGGGLSAWFQAEFNMPMERLVGRDAATSGSTASSSRNSGVGLRGGFGNVYFGTWESPWTQTFRLWDVGTIGGWGPTTSIVGRREATNSGVSRNTTGADVALQGVPTFGTTATQTNLGYSLWRRFQSSVFYESPLFGGAQVKVAFMPNEMKKEGGSTAENPSAWSASLTWSGMGGNARAFIATMQAKDWSSVGQRDGGWTVGGGYNFGVVNLGATFETYTYKTGSDPAAGGSGIGDIKVRQYGLGASVPVGSGRIGASFAQARDIKELAGNEKARMWNLGYEHALSKRTAVGVGIAQITNEDNVGFTWTGQTSGPSGADESVTPGVDQRNIFVSVRHSF